MALEDKDLFNAIFNKYSDQPIEFVMEQYEKAKILNLEIERRVCGVVLISHLHLSHRMPRNSNK